MGNFEKLSVLVIGVIIVMILVVAIYTWTGNPDETGGPETAFVPTDDVVSTNYGLGASVKDPAADWSAFDEDITKGTGIEEVIVEDVENLRAPPPVKDVVAKVEETRADTPVVAAAEEQTYKIQSNDTLGLISQKFYGTTKHWTKIAQRNDLVPERLRVGKTIFIPALDVAPTVKGSSPSAEPVASKLTGAKPGSLYKVRGGETIEEIARAAYGSMERWPYIYVNNLEVLDNPRVLPAGTELRLPE